MFNPPGMIAMSSPSVLRLWVTRSAVSSRPWHDRRVPFFDADPTRCGRAPGSPPFTAGTEAVKVRPPDHHGVRAEHDRLDDVAVAADAAIADQCDAGTDNVTDARHHLHRTSVRSICRPPWFESSMASTPWATALSASSTRWIPFEDNLQAGAPRGFNHPVERLPRQRLVEPIVHIVRERDGWRASILPVIPRRSLLARRQLRRRYSAAARSPSASSCRERCSSRTADRGWLKPSPMTASPWPQTT